MMFVCSKVLPLHLVGHRKLREKCVFVIMFPVEFYQQQFVYISHGFHFSVDVFDLTPHWFLCKEFGSSDVLFKFISVEKFIAL